MIAAAAMLFGACDNHESVRVPDFSIRVTRTGEYSATLLRESSTPYVLCMRIHSATPDLWEEKFRDYRFEYVQSR